MKVIEITPDERSGSATVFIVDYELEIAIELARIPWNEVAATGIPTSRKAALGIAEHLYPDAKAGTFPEFFSVSSLRSAIDEVFKYADMDAMRKSASHSPEEKVLMALYYE